jgi:hypothetical protein
MFAQLHEWPADLVTAGPTRTNHNAELPPAPTIVEAAGGGRYVLDAGGRRFRYVAPPPFVWDRDDWPTMRVGAADAVAEPLDLDRARAALAGGASVWVDGSLGEARLALLTATLAELNAAFDARYRVWPLDPAEPMGDSGSLHEVFGYEPAAYNWTSFAPNQPRPSFADWVDGSGEVPR